MRQATYVCDGVDVGTGQAEMTDDLEAPVVSGQVERSSAMLHAERQTGGFGSVPGSYLIVKLSQKE